MTNSPCTAFSRSGALLLVAATLAVPGCSGESTDADRTDLMIPDQFESDGTTWSNNGTMSNEDMALLTQFFRTQPELSDSPELKGSPVVFAGSNAGRRYYWLNQTGDQISWCCVGCEDGYIAFAHGSGSPF